MPCLLTKQVLCKFIFWGGVDNVLLLLRRNPNKLLTWKSVWRTMIRFIDEINKKNKLVIVEKQEVYEAYAKNPTLIIST